MNYWVHVATCAAEPCSVCGVPLGRRHIHSNRTLVLLCGRSIWHSSEALSGIFSASLDILSHRYFAFSLACYLAFSLALHLTHNLTCVLTLMWRSIWHSFWRWLYLAFHFASFLTFHLTFYLTFIWHLTWRSTYILTLIWHATSHFIRPCWDFGIFAVSGSHASELASAHNPWSAPKQSRRTTGGRPTWSLEILWDPHLAGKKAMLNSSLTNRGITLVGSSSVLMTVNDS